MGWQEKLAIGYGIFWLILIIAAIILLIWTIHKRRIEKKEEAIKHKDYDKY